MTKVRMPDALRSAVVYKKFGVSNGFGNIILGFTRLGEDNIFAGIYRRRRSPHGISSVKMRFYRPKVGRSVNQAPLRDKFQAAIAAWQAKTEEERQVLRDYWHTKRERAYNVFITEYLSTH